MNKVLLGASLAVTLLVSACSQAPAEVSGGLGAQFGTAGSDAATIVATNAAHPYVFVAGGYYDNSGDQNRAFLRRFNRDGTLAWERLAPKFAGSSSAQEVATDTSGNVYFSYSGDTNPNPNEAVSERYLVKFDKNGKQLWRRAESPDSYGPLEVDRQGNLYVATSEAGSRVNKFAPDGREIWVSRYNPDFSISEMAVSDAGELFVVGSDYSKHNPGTAEGYVRAALRKYSARGELKFDRTVARDIQTLDLAFGNGGVYVVHGSAGYAGAPLYLNKYDRTGQLLLKRTVTPGAEDHAAIRDLSADEAGNVYLTGFISHTNLDDTSSDLYEDDVFVRKYTPALRPVWTYNPKRPGSSEVGFGIDARSSGEAYAVGSSTAKVNGVNRGGNDAFLMRLNAQGQKVWER